MSRATDLLALTKLYLPTNFLCDCTDAKILAYLDLVLAEVNATTPWTAYTLDNMPAGWDQIICFGATLYSTLFMAAGYSLQDFSYNDNGLSLNVDRQAKLTASYNTSLKAYETMKWNLKKAEVWKNGIYGLGTPRFQSQIGQFLKILYGNTWYH